MAGDCFPQYIYISLIKKQLQKRLIKIKKHNITLYLIFLILLLILSSCTKPECKTSADCGTKACTLSKCVDKKCISTPQKNCCGNSVKESIENGKPGNQCTCPQDYGKCEGKAKIHVGSRLEDATYAHYYCNAANQCVLGIEQNEAASQSFLDSINIGFFKASSIIKYNKPFALGKDNFEFRITLDDSSKDLVLPVKLTKIKLLYTSQSARAEQLIAEKDFDNTLKEVGDKVIINESLPLDYKPPEIEEIGSLRYGIDYTYTKQVVSGRTANGTNVYSAETLRSTFSSPSKPIFFVRSD